jgi:hypothetical protein
MGVGVGASVGSPAVGRVRVESIVGVDDVPGRAVAVELPGW